MCHERTYRGLASSLRIPLTAYQVNNVAVVLRFLVELHVSMYVVAAQVVTCQVNQHYVLCILFWVGQWGGCQLLICLLVSTASSMVPAIGSMVACRPSIFTVGFGRRTEDAESAEVRSRTNKERVNAAQCTVKLEVVAFEFLDEAARQNYWKTSPRRQ